MYVLTALRHVIWRLQDILLGRQYRTRHTIYFNGLKSSKEREAEEYLIRKYRRPKR